MAGKRWKRPAAILTPILLIPAAFAWWGRATSAPLRSVIISWVLVVLAPLLAIGELAASHGWTYDSSAVPAVRRRIVTAASAASLALLALSVAIAPRAGRQGDYAFAAGLAVLALANLIGRDGPVSLLAAISALALAALRVFG